MIPIDIRPESRILIVAPHPDDECIGAGGVLVKYAAQCDVVLLTNGCACNPERSKEENIATRRGEFASEMAVAGVHRHWSLGIDDGTLAEHADCLLDFDLAPYSSAHLEEERHRMMEEQAAYIAFLDNFTRMWELRPIDDSSLCVLMQESSRCCMERVKRDDGVRVTDDVEQTDLAFMRHIREADAARRMSAKELSSIPPDQIFEEMQDGELYRQRIANFHQFWGWPDDAVRHTFDEFRHQAEPKAGYCRWNVLEHYIETMMDFLNAIPYHQDRLARTKGSMTHDITHAIYGAFCDFFVTDDKKLTYRLKALYHWMEVSAEVMGLQAFREKFA